MLFLQNDEIVNINITDKQSVMEKIESMEKQGLTTLEAVSCFMEENSIPESLYLKYIPTPIIEKIRREALEENLMRPSVTQQNTIADLDFLNG